MAFGDQITGAGPLMSGVRISAVMHVQPGSTRGLCTWGWPVSASTGRSSGRTRCGVPKGCWSAG